MTKSLLLVLLTVVCGVGGQLALKAGMEQVGRIGSQQTIFIVDTIVRVLTTPLILIGLACYGLGATAWLVVLSRLALNFAYPFLALNFALITLASRLVLGEAVPMTRWVGVLIICLGVLVVARS